MQPEMTIRQRLMRCRLIEEAEEHPEISEDLGIVNRSEFGGSFKDLSKSLNRVLNRESIRDLAGDICDDLDIL